MQGAQIKAWMQHSGLTRTELAARSGVRVTNVSVILCHVAQLQRGLLESGCPLHLLLPEFFSDALCDSSAELEAGGEPGGVSEETWLAPDNAIMDPFR